MSFRSLGSLSVSALLASLVVGQTLRFPLPGQGGGLLISDLAVIICLFAAVLWSFGHGDLIDRRSLVMGMLLTPFILWSLFTLVIRAPELGLHNAAIAFAYWARLAAHLLLLPALLILFQDSRLAAFTRRGLIIATVLLILLGFLQLWLVPDFTVLTKLGWDPHQSRLTSTWLDPNFFGAFLVIMLLFVLSHLISAARVPLGADSRPFSAWSPSGVEGRKGPRPRSGPLEAARMSGAEERVATLGLSVLIISIIIALVLTQSRSAIIAFVLSASIFSPLLTARTLRRATFDKFIIVVSVILLALVVIVVSAIFLRDRLSGLATLDSTVQLRLSSLQEAWSLAQRRPWLGVGYNAYQFSAAESGLISNFTIHSRAGADNSLLTLWVTTGLVGVVLFLAPWAFVGQILFRRWTTNNSHCAPAALTGLVALFIHSQFVNSMLYSHLLITLIVIVALALNEHSVKSKEQRVKQQLKT